MTTAANPTLGKIEDIVERFGLFALCEVGLNALFVAIPWLNTWPIGTVIRNLTELLCNKLFAALRLVIDLKAIKFVNDQHQKTFEREVVRLRITARELGIDSEEFKKEKKIAHDAFAAFVRFNAA